VQGLPNDVNGGICAIGFGGEKPCGGWPGVGGGIGGRAVIKADGGEATNCGR